MIAYILVGVALGITPTLLWAGSQLLRRPRGVPMDFPPYRPPWWLVQVRWTCPRCGGQRCEEVPPVTTALHATGDVPCPTCAYKPDTHLLGACTKCGDTFVADGMKGGPPEKCPKCGHQEPAVDPFSVPDLRG